MNPFGTIETPPGIEQYGGVTGGGLVRFINNILLLLITVAGLYALINFILAGYSFLSAGGDAKQVEASWAKIWQSILGLVVVAASFALAAIFGQIIFGDWGAILNPQIYVVTP